MNTCPLPTYEDVSQAAMRLTGHTVHTPVLTSDTLNEQYGFQMFFKCENLQRTGAFKFRGATNAVACLSAEQRAAGVMTFSSGNHAQAIALACKLAGIQATIVMPTDAPQSKLTATRAYGATIVPYDRYQEDREHIARTLIAQHGYHFIPPYDHPHIIAGQGTAAKELFDATGPLDALITPVGGGGLLAGSSLAARALSAGCEVYGAEPALGDDARQSLHTGAIVHIAPPRTIADGAQTQHVGALPFAIIQASVTDIWTAPDEDLVQGMQCLAQHLKLIVEPTGCLGLAAALQQRDVLQGKRVGIILSGGNVDMERFCTLLTPHA